MATPRSTTDRHRRPHRRALQARERRPKPSVIVTPLPDGDVPLPPAGHFGRFAGWALLCLVLIATAGVLFGAVAHDPLATTGLTLVVSWGVHRALAGWQLRT